jgi:lantibiotic biosynthesis protein
MKPQKYMTETRQQYAQIASKIALKICRDAIWNGDACNWISVSNEDHFGTPKAYAKALNLDFYSGTSGILFYLISVHKIFKDDILEETIRGTVNQILSQIQSLSIYGKLGFHTGLSGISFALISAGENLNNASWTTQGLQLMEEIDGLDLAEQGLDVIDGAAGTIPLLIRYAQQFDRPQLLKIAEKLGNHLLEKAQISTQGISWNTAGPQKQNLTGQAHGTSGIATGLLDLYVATKNEKYKEAALKALQYENHHFSHQHQNWADFRDFSQISGLTNAPTEASFSSCAWCHGAAGIALSRLRAYQVLDDSTMKKDAEIAIEKTLQELRFQAIESTSLCHGIAGNSDILITASQILNKPELTIKANESGDYMIKELFQKNIPFTNGLHNTHEIPDMMLGSAGVGYFFLRLYDAKQFESILLVSP